MKKNWIALLLAAMMVLSLLAGCGAGSAASSAEPAASAASAETEQAAGTETEPAEAPQAEEPAEAASAEEPAAEEPAEEGYVPRINFPGSDTARLHYSNTYELPISEDGATLTWMRTALNLMGPLGELGLTELQDLDAI